MADLTQSSATTATTTPGYYSDYISNLAKQGTQYGVGGPNAPTYVGAQPLQTQAFETAQANVGNYQPGLTAAGGLLGQGAGVDITGAANPYLQSGTSSSADLVGGYMNPYVSNVVDQIRQANQQNIAQNLSPGITAGAVGSGQFGSQRGANALALGISNADIGALAQQAAALQSGYSDALKAAQAQRAAQVSAGQIAGNMATQEAQKFRDLAAQRMNLAGQQQTAGIADVNQLATMGAQQQQIAQNKELFPLDVLSKQAGVLSGAQIPTTQTSTMTGSPLSMIAGLGSTAAGLFSPKQSIDPLTGKVITTTPWAELSGSLKSAFGGATTPGAPPPPSTDTGTPSPSPTTDPRVTPGTPPPPNMSPLPTTDPRVTPGTPPPPDTSGPVPNNLSPTGYSDMNGKPVNPDGTPYYADQSQDETTTGGYYDENGNWVENP
jgi:hypothetical protein